MITRKLTSFPLNAKSERMDVTVVYLMKVVNGKKFSQMAHVSYSWPFVPVDTHVLVSINIAFQIGMRINVTKTCIQHVIINKFHQKN